jgi:transcriptional antiterminator RfaH
MSSYSRASSPAVLPIQVVENVVFYASSLTSCFWHPNCFCRPSTRVRAGSLHRVLGALNWSEILRGLEGCESRWQRFVQMSTTPMIPATDFAKDPPDAQWLAAFTQCHHESRVARQLEVRNVEYFLPTYEKVSQWRDRRVRLKQVLFPGYLFVRVKGVERRQVLEARGVVSLVGPPGRPVEIEPEEIRRLQAAVLNYPVEPIEYLKIGERVSIQGGPLRGVSGILHRKSNKLRVVISVDAITRSFLVEVEAALIAKEV